MKVYGWTGYGRPRREFDREFPDTPEWIRQTREIVAAHSKAEVGRVVGERPARLFNLSETGNTAEIEVATAEPGVVFWKPLDDRSGRWARAA